MLTSDAEALLGCCREIGLVICGKHQAHNDISQPQSKLYELMLCTASLTPLIDAPFHFFVLCLFSS